MNNVIQALIYYKVILTNELYILFSVLQIRLTFLAYSGYMSAAFNLCRLIFRSRYKDTMNELGVQ
jgi:hypothetical protein